jgi:hypothetical protein
MENYTMTVEEKLVVIDDKKPVAIDDKELPVAKAKKYVYVLPRPRPPRWW